MGRPPPDRARRAAHGPTRTAGSRPSPSDRHAGRQAVFVAIAIATVGVLPVFLTGGLAVQIRAELAFGPGALGIAVAAFFAATSLGAVSLGRTVESIGAAQGVRVTAAVGAVSLGILALARSWWQLVLGLCVGGLANAVAHPAANLSLSQAVPRGRLGLAFGIKQSAVPMATLLGGASVPVIALAVGWRWAFVAGAVAALSCMLLGSRAPDVELRRGPPGRSMRAGDVPVAPMIVVALGGGLGAAAATSLGTFLVDSGVDAGLTEAGAGVLFAVASILGLVVRIVLGWLLDQRPQASTFQVIAVLLVVGAVGYALLATGRPALYAAGALLGFGAGWAWPGAYHFAVVRENPRAPAAATGIVQAGLSLGGGLGPLTFGLVAERASYSVAWSVAGGVTAAAAVAILFGRLLVRRHKASRLADEPHGGDAAARDGPAGSELHERSGTQRREETR